MSWPEVTDSKYLIHRHMRYEYPAPIDDLRHRLVVIPPKNHGDQQRVDYRLDVSDSAHEMTTGRDLFGNMVVTSRWRASRRRLTSTPGW